MSTDTRIDLPSQLPCLHLLRASGLAVDPRKMLLGGLALCVLLLGDGLIAKLPFAPESAITNSGFQADYLQPPVALRMGTGSSSHSLATGVGLLLSPIRSVLAPGLIILKQGSEWTELAWAWTRMLWALLVWSLAGGAIARMAAIQFAQKKRIRIGQALRFSGRQFLGYLTAPFLPLAGVLCLLGFMSLDSWIASLIPVAGDFIVGLFWIVALFFGFLMAMMLTGFAVGWPLMVSAISTEDSDGFDGLSRAIGFWFDRPWYAVLLIVLVVPVFLLAWMLVSYLIGMTVYLAAWSVSAGSGSPGITFEAVRSSPLMDQPWWYGWLYQTPAPVPSTDGAPSGFIAAWTYVPAVLLAGFGPSFFWSATTVIYFLLRESDDGTALTDVVDWRDAPPDATADESEGEPTSDENSADATERPAGD